MKEEAPLPRAERVRCDGSWIQTFLFAIVSMLAVIGLAHAQPEQHRSVLDPQLVTRIETGDELAFVQAADSGDQIFIAPLLRALHGRKSQDSATLLESLARLDEPTSQQRIWCRSIGTNEPVIAMTSYSAIRGWYSIRALLAIANGAADRNFLRSNQFHRELDAPPPTPSWFALVLLTEMLPEADIALGTPEEWQAGVTRTLWSDWVNAHDAELRGRTPFGAGVRLTEDACSSQR